ncbi:hypothetical protein PsYK624_006290 [Phanerochaete sordida]|uniref:RING-type domain-containing protein n=1 Tax=Phanerochaete sordida TaxID=48140 RepID=A0A9P3L824_9APHY|nr:hypothetical protein PsYK624_006290 [Phanerochaete sordida]
MKTLRSLKRDVTDLQKKNAQLQEDLTHALEAAENVSQPKPGKRGGPSVKQLQTKVDGLRKQVAELERSRQRDKRKISQLRAKEIRKDAEELQDQADFEVGDTAHKMRKLLRRFHDLMLAPSLEGDEDCKICFDKLEPRNSISLTCEHVFCKPCTQKLAPGYEDSVRCPECRREVLKDDLETVDYLASDQWDALLDVAKQWAKMDRRRGEIGTSDEEQQEEFIDDGRETSESSSKPEPEQAESSSPPPVVGKRRLTRRTLERSPSVASSVPGEEEVRQVPEADDADGRISTPPPVESSGSQDAPHTPSYAASPVSVKRRRLEQLAESRNKKRRV